MRRIGTLVAVAVIGAASLVGGCNKGPSTAQCEELLGHVVDIELAAAGVDGTGAAGAAAPAPLTDAQKKALADSKVKVTEKARADFMGRCAKEVPKSYVECGLKAADHAALAACEKN